jgi:nucleoside-diphosphate-sugar epimerase
MSRVLVTGGSGFVGKAVIESLLENGYSVRATYRTGKPASLPGAEWVHTKDLSAGEFKPLLDGCDYVVHLAALAHQLATKVPSSEFDRVNHLATADLARTVAESTTVRRLVFVSSIGAVCSSSEEVVRPQTECRPDTDYGRSKRAAELGVQKILANTPQDYCIIRPPLVYGPGNPGNMLRLMRLTKSRAPLPLGAVRNRRTFVYIGNLVDVIERTLAHPGASRQVFNVADSEMLSTPQLIAELGKLGGGRARMLPMPPWTLRLLGRVGDVIAKVRGRSIGIDTYSVDRLLGSLEIDNSEVRRKLEWQPRFSTQEGLRLTMQPESRSTSVAAVNAASRPE